MDKYLKKLDDSLKNKNLNWFWCFPQEKTLKKI